MGWYSCLLLSPKGKIPENTTIVTRMGYLTLFEYPYPCEKRVSHLSWLGFSLSILFGHRTLLVCRELTMACNPTDQASEASMVLKKHPSTFLCPYVYFLTPASVILKCVVMLCSGMHTLCLEVGAWRWRGWGLPGAVRWGCGLLPQDLGFQLTHRQDSAILNYFSLRKHLIEAISRPYFYYSNEIHGTNHIAVTDWEAPFPFLFVQEQDEDKGAQKFCSNLWGKSAFSVTGSWNSLLCKAEVPKALHVSKAGMLSLGVMIHANEGRGTRPGGLAGIMGAAREMILRWVVWKARWHLHGLFLRFVCLVVCFLRRVVVILYILKRESRKMNHIWNDRTFPWLKGNSSLSFPVFF